jgi:hypothetical protein
MSRINHCCQPSSGANGICPDETEEWKWPARRTCVDVVESSHFGWQCHVRGDGKIFPSRSYSSGLFEAVIRDAIVIVQGTRRQSEFQKVSRVDGSTKGRLLVLFRASLRDQLSAVVWNTQTLCNVRICSVF